MTMSEILALIGQAVDSEVVQSLVVANPIVSSTEDDLDEGVSPRSYLSNHRDGYELTHVAGRITAAHLFVEPTSEFQPFLGALVSDLTPDSTRNEVRQRLGQPSRSREATISKFLGPQGPWDRYDGERFCVHFQYGGTDDTIRLITLMTIDVAP
jgi:hypothetical protein